MTDPHHDPSPRADLDPDLAHEQYRNSDECRERAWEWAVDAEPTHLTEHVLNAYENTHDYDRGFDLWERGL